MAKAKTTSKTTKPKVDRNKVKVEKPAKAPKLPPVFKTLKPNGKMTAKNLDKLKDKNGEIRFLLPPYPFGLEKGVLPDDLRIQAEAAACPNDTYTLTTTKPFVAYASDPKKNTITVLVTCKVEQTAPGKPLIDVLGDDPVDHNLNPVGTETMRVEHGPGVMEDKPRAFDPNPADAADTGGLPRISATISSDDGTYTDVPFDATMWFEIATDGELCQLCRDGWGHEYSSDAIADFMRAHDADVEKVMAYVESIQDVPAKKDVCGFSVKVDKELALTWIGNHRGHLADAIAKIESGEETPPAGE